MLPAGNRLRRRRDFATAVRRGRRAGRPTVVVHFHAGLVGAPEDSSGGSVPLVPLAQVGFVVARPVGGAVTRNAVHRRLRHLMRERLDRVPPGSLFVVRATPAAAGATYAQLAADLDSALDRVLSDRTRSHT